MKFLIHIRKNNTMVNRTRENIIAAFFRYAQKHPLKTSVTLSEIAKEAQISKQAVYQKHFSSMDELIQEIHKIMTAEILKELYKIPEDNKCPLFEELADSVLPIIHKYREGLKILYNTSLDSTWISFVEENYRSWLVPRIKIDVSQLEVSEKFFLKYISRQIVSLIALWISEDKPCPPEIYKPIFLNFLNCSLNNLINDKV